ncbi:MAG: O-antigen ligase family protein [Candidatus Accumulibacter delftensis]|jgi:O-antigen ligase
MFDSLRSPRNNQEVIPATTGRKGSERALLAIFGFLAVFSALLVNVAPTLIVLFFVAMLALAALCGAFWLARRMASGHRRMAVNLFLLWVFVVNLPAFFAFDPTGMTRGDLINPQSIGRILLTLLVGLAFLFNRFGTGTHKKANPSTLQLALFPFFIFGWYALVAPLTVTRGVDFLLITFRLGEWLLFIFLVITTARDAEVRDPGSFLEQPLRYLWPVVVFIVAITFIILPLAPRLVYIIGESGVGRVGNPFVHPNVLGIVAGMGVFYAMEMRFRFRGWYVAIFLAVLAATYSRGAWVGFILAASAYAVMRYRAGLPRAVFVVLLGITLSLAYVARDSVIDMATQVATRSTNREDLSSLSERTAVWRAAEILIRQSPWLGHGFIVGPKKLNDVMASGSSGGYFRAYHAHNEFIQAMINAGIPAALLVLSLLVRWAFLVRALARDARNSAFLRCSVTWMIQLLAYGILTPLISTQFLMPGAFFLYLYLCAELKYRARPLAQRNPAPTSVHASYSEVPRNRAFPGARSP